MSIIEGISDLAPNRGVQPKEKNTVTNNVSDSFKVYRLRR